MFVTTSPVPEQPNRENPLIDFRPFHNTDPPRLTKLWNFGHLGTGAALDFPNDALDIHVLAAPYFERQGLIFAHDGKEAVGFVHAGFGANAAGTGICRETGVISAVVVRMDRRRQGIGRELVSRAETYLRGAGAKTIYAGESGTRNPFYLGLYGGAECAGFLETDPNAAPFFSSLGYAPAERYLVFRRNLSTSKEAFDPRVMGIKRSMKVGISDRPLEANWWWLTRHGRFDSLTFTLLPNKGGPAAAQLTCWGMDFHGMTRGERTVGLTDVFVAEGERRKGYARALIGEALRRMREELFSHAEVTIRDDNPAAIALFESLAFTQADRGVVYLKAAG
ncbi:MAG: GNAT family N-acetyltransferase [Planctomycetales bacterium]